MDTNSFFFIINKAFPGFPWWHWAVMLVVAFGVALALRKKKNLSVHATVSFAFTVFVGLFLVDGIVLDRLPSQHKFFSGLDLITEYHRLIECNELQMNSMLLNVLVFIPFGFFLYEYVSEAGHQAVVKNLKSVIMFTFLLSMSIELAQWILKVGFLELTDMILNTIGAALGATLAFVGRAVAKTKSNV